MRGQGVDFTSGATVVIIGPVNAGKSSLFNALVGSKRAIVSEIAGTTRDIVERTIIIGGIEVCLQDTAGIRKDPSGRIEQLGIEAGIDAALAADMVILLAPAHQAYPPMLEHIEKKVGRQATDKGWGICRSHRDQSPVELRFNGLDCHQFWHFKILSLELPKHWQVILI